MSIEDIRYPSYNAKDTIQGWIYTPITKPRGIIQIVHGFGEHSRRYMHMILTFLDEGYIVCANDHVAHGVTAKINDSWGYPGNKGYMTTIEDEHSLRQLVEEKYPALPYVMFGHSWGSMIARGYGAKYHKGMQGLILCGIASQMKSLNAMGREKIHQDIKDGKGTQEALEYMGQLFAGMTERYQNPKGPNDWIAKSAQVVADHGADPNNLQKPATIQLMADFVDLYDDVMSPKWAEKIPNELPVHIIAGDGDPVANYGEGAYHVLNMLSEKGHRKVTCKVYPGYRHEIHNEPEIRQEVEGDLVAYINGIV